MPTRKRNSGPRAKKSTVSRTEPLVIYVHGIGHQDSPADVKLEWDLALFGREMDKRTQMAYWSDILHPNSRSRTATKSLSLTGDTVDPDALLRQALVDTSNEQAQAMARSLLHTFGVTHAGPGAKALPLPAFLRKPLARAFLESLVKDTAAYFFRKGMREKIQRRLRDVLQAWNGDVVIVAHSQGSIIALEVLASLPKASTVEVDHFITIGSPLGIREVQDFLSCDLVVPGKVKKWSNFADPIDPVALDKGLGNDFSPSERTAITDEIVVNTRSRQFEKFNPHSAAGYLAHPKVRKAVHEAARIDTHAPFLVARDVVADLATDDRLPVLIEILEPGYPALGETDKQLLNREKKEEEIDLKTRIARAEKILKEKIVAKESWDDARIDCLRRYVAARLTPSEIGAVARQHRDLRVYKVWRSTMKRKLLNRSSAVIQVDAAQASYRAEGEGIRWAVLDTGVRRDHPHFKTHETIVDVWDCTKPGPPKLIGNDKDDDGHGTHVAGIIAGASPDDADEKLKGIAPRTKLVVYKVLDDDGTGEDAWIIKALDHIAEQNENNSGILIHGLNLSLGGPYDASVYGCGFSPICAELRRLWRAGVLVCVASGNEGKVEVTTPDGEVELNSPMSIGDPANLEDCIAVGSVNADSPHLYGVSFFSSRGPTSDGRLKPDVVAPGERIRSCNSHFRSNKKSTLYREESGTSMAAPHVSGLLAAFLSVRREFRGRPDEVKEILLRTCTDVGRDRYHQGHGIPNLMKMLLEV